jgi:RNA methyltransferase, TrmH family
MLSKNEVKHIQSLGHKKGRAESGHFLAEGTKLVVELLQQQPGQLVRLYATASFLEQYRQLIPSDAAIEVSDADLQRITQLQTPNQAVAVVQQFLNKTPKPDSDGWLLVLDGIRDPGNMGTLMRLADWFGIQSVIGSDDCADIYNPKVVQASMGSLFRVPFYETDLVSFLSSSNKPVVGAVLDGQPVQQVSFGSSGALVIGSEATGIRSEVLAQVQQKVSIPSFGGAESLNAAVAAGILLWELKRG